MQPVHLLVVAGDVRAQAHVLGGDDRAGLGDDRLGQATHLGKGAAPLGGDGCLGEAQAGLLGHVLGQITHALEGSGDAHGAQDDAEVAGHRLVEGNQIEAAFLDRVRQGVDP